MKGSEILLQLTFFHNYDLQLKDVTEDKIIATHTTPKKHYIDDLTFTFKKNGSELCDVEVEYM